MQKQETVGNIYFFSQCRKKISMKMYDFSILAAFWIWNLKVLLATFSIMNQNLYFVIIVIFHLFVSCLRFWVRFKFQSLKNSYTFFKFFKVWTFLHFFQTFQHFAYFFFSTKMCKAWYHFQLSHHLGMMMNQFWIWIFFQTFLD